MPKLTIDHREVEVAPGVTILEAARRLGIEVPTLCFRDGCEPSTSCMVCMVKLAGENRLVPSCGTLAVDGMQVDSETVEVHRARRTALELLLSDHVGDCLAPCQFGCPAHMDIPTMLRQIAAGDLRGAIATVKRDIALPAVLGRVCPKPCEKVCRRAAADGAVAICELKRYVADVDLASNNPYLPSCQPRSGKQVAIVGAGPCGLSAAYYLLGRGHAVTLLDDQPKPGGRLRQEFDETILPQDVLDREIDQILRLGVQFRANATAGREPDLRTLQDQFDAVLIAWGAAGKAWAERWGLPTGTRGVIVKKDTFQTDHASVFAAGNAIRENAMVVRSVADGKEAAAAIDQYLAGQPVRGIDRPFSTRIGHMTSEELSQLITVAGGLSQFSRSGGLSQFSRSENGTVPFVDAQSAIQQARRCLHCDCSARDDCRLRICAAQYGADPNRYRSERRPFQRIGQPGAVIYEPGKCINCGLCIEVARRWGAPLGLTFVGRGFDVRMGVPFDWSLDEALGPVAAQCVAVCPTGALALAGERCGDPMSRSRSPAAF